MIRLKFDPSECMHPITGIRTEHLVRRQDGLCHVRDQLCSAEGAGFLTLPKRLHEEYESRRGESELGKVFRTANGIHDQIDAVVVIGADRSTMGIKGLMQACCDPYHNELSRAARGSKPRMYFAGSNLDNDSISSLLNRIKEGGHGETNADRRWALVIINSGDAEHEADAMLVARVFVQQLRESLGEESAEQMARYMTLISDGHPRIRQLADETDCLYHFCLPKNLQPGFELLSPVGLLPAALLGLDCMKLLGGAHEMSQHFIYNDFDENVPLQIVALLSELSERGKSLWLLQNENPALNALNSWCQFLTPHAMLKTLVNVPLHGAHDAENAIVVNLRVLADRCDAVFRSRTDDDAPKANENELTVDQRQNAAAPSMEFTIPRIDMFELGELLQMWMIVARLQSKI